MNWNSPPGDFSDVNDDINADSYSNLEEYLNYLAAGGGTQPHFRISKTAVRSIYLICNNWQSIDLTATGIRLHSAGKHLNFNQ